MGAVKLSNASMADAGFFRGTSYDQDNRFANKQKKLMKNMKFAPILDKKVSTSKINMDILKPWITRKVTEMLGMEDDVLIEFIYNQLEEEVVASSSNSRLNLVD